MGLEGHDVILCQITSRPLRDNYALPLGAADFEDGSLSAPGNIRPNKLFTADSRIVLRRAGTIREQKLTEVIDRTVAILQG